MKLNNIYNSIVQGNYSTPNDTYAIMCLDIITKIYPIYEEHIYSQEDAFLVASCFNYLNAYIKTSESDCLKIFKKFYSKHPEIEEYLISKNEEYGEKVTPYVQVNNKKDAYKCFKKLVVPFMRKIDFLFADDDNIICSPQQDKGMSLALIQIYGVQFSFHQVPIFKDSSPEYYDKMNDHSTWVQWKGLRLQPLATHTLNCALQLENINEKLREIVNKYTSTSVMEKC